MAHKVSILNESNFDSEVLSPASTVMVQFSTPWCGPCRTLTPIFEKIAEEVGDACKMCKIDVEDNYHIASRFLCYLFKDRSKSSTWSAPWSTKLNHDC